MWCKSCRQEVPGIAAPSGQGFCCARCQELIVVSPEAVESASIAPPANTVTQPTLGSLDSSLPEYWAWQVNQQLRHAEQVIQSGRRRQLPSGQQLRIDEAWNKTLANNAATGPTLEPNGEDSPLATFAWFVISAGVTALTCGSVLMALSFYQERPELWTVGLPIMIVGQVGLVLGMGLQLVARTRDDESAASQETGTRSNRSTLRETNRSTPDR